MQGDISSKSFSSLLALLLTRNALSFASVNNCGIVIRMENLWLLDSHRHTDKNTARIKKGKVATYSLWHLLPQKVNYNQRLPSYII